MKHPPIDLMKAQILRRGHHTVWHWRLRANPRLAIERSKCNYGGDERYADRFRVVEYIVGCWTIRSRHRKRAAAVRTLPKPCPI